MDWQLAETVKWWGVGEEDRWALFYFSLNIPNFKKRRGKRESWHCLTGDSDTRLPGSNYFLVLKVISCCCLKAITDFFFHIDDWKVNYCSFHPTVFKSMWPPILCGLCKIPDNLITWISIFPDSCSPWTSLTKNYSKLSKYLILLLLWVLGFFLHSLEGTLFLCLNNVLWQSYPKYHPFQEFLLSFPRWVKY